jgi:hypothetical protein
MERNYYNNWSVSENIILGAGDGVTCSYKWPSFLGVGDAFIRPYK